MQAEETPDENVAEDQVQVHEDNSKAYELSMLGGNLQNRWSLSLKDNWWQEWGADRKWVVS